MGGIQFPWDSARVLLPLVLAAGLVLFVTFEKIWAQEPIVPSISIIVGFAGTLCKGARPILSSIETLGFAVVAPTAKVAGVVVTVSQKYGPCLWTGWCLMIVGSALMTAVKASTPLGHVVGFTVIGVGWIYAVVQFPIQTPLPIGLNAQSMALLLSHEHSIWGVLIGNTVLQNILQRQLPQEFTGQFSGGVPIIYALAISTITSLPPILQEQVRMAFSDGLKLLWKIALGLVSALPMLEFPMIGVVDDTWALRESEEDKAAVLPPMSKV